MGAELFLKETGLRLEKLRDLAEKAARQVSDEEFFRQLAGGDNSIAILFKHVAGNMRSRWTDFLTTDGDKPDRRRDLEFVIEEGDTREALTAQWDAGWKCFLDTLRSLQPTDLSRVITIRGQEHTVVDAIQGALIHCAQHVGQVIFLAKHLRGESWKTLFPGV